MLNKNLTNEIAKLDLSDKLQLVGDVWDAIAKDNKQISLTDWQLLELDKRYEYFQSGDYVLKNTDAVHEELKNKYE